MAFSIKYIPLFKINIHHLFFLNRGLDEYNSMSDANKSKQKDNYNVNDFFKIFPAYETQQKLKGHNLVFKTGHNGITIWSKVTGANKKTPFISLNDDLDFSFVIQIKDSRFYNYSDIKMENAGKTLYFSNKRLSSEPNTFPLINKKGDNSKIDESFVLSEVGTFKEKAKLLVSEQDNLFGIITVFMKADNSSLHITDSQGKIPDPFKEFELQINNRKTFWRFIFNQEQTVVAADDVIKEGVDSKILISETEQPLTQRGFISLELGGVELPNPDDGLVIPDISNNKYYSEIYM